MSEQENMEQNALPTYEDILAAQQITFQDVMDHMTGPVVSIVFHIVLVALGSSYIVFEPQDLPSELEVTMENVEIKEFEKPPKPPEAIEQSEEIDVEIDSPDIEAPDVGSVDDVEVDDVVLDSTIPDIGITMNNSALKLPGIYKMRTAAGRKTAVKKYNNTKSSGRSRAVSSRVLEVSTNKGLGWLGTNQNPDGSWGECSKVKNYLSALATLALLAHGETPSSESHGDVMLKAIKYLVSVAGKSPGKGLEGTIEYALVGYALAEAYVITKIPMIKPAMETQIKAMIAGMSKDGAYNIGYNNYMVSPYQATQREWDAGAAKAAANAAKRKGKGPKTRSAGAGVMTKTKKATSKRPKTPPKKLKKDPNGIYFGDRYIDVSGWHYQALKAAYAAGCEVEGLADAIKRGTNALKNTFYIGNGHWGYTNKNSRPDATVNKCKGREYRSTNVGMLCLQLFGEGGGKEVAAGIKYITGHQNGMYLKCKWQDIVKGANLIYKNLNTPDYKLPDNILPSEDGAEAMSIWYYQTQIFFQYYKGKGGVWDKWNAEFTRELTSQQERDGHWNSPTHKYSKESAYGETSRSINITRTNTGGSRTDLIIGRFSSQQDDLANAVAKPDEESMDLKVYCTSLATLMLTVYYRYLPTYKLEKGGASASTSATIDDFGLTID